MLCTIDSSKKKRVRKVKAKRGYYASSDEEGGDKADEPANPPAKRQRRKNDICDILSQVKPGTAFAKHSEQFLGKHFRGGGKSGYNYCDTAVQKFMQS